MASLGVNIDHVATVRQARRTNEPDPVWAATLAELGGADGITLHLREDRRHIQERDVRLLKETVAVPTNLELACSDDVLRIACEVVPNQATLVPERREEVTTEGGLDVAGNRDLVAAAVDRLQQAGIVVSLFIDPSFEQIAASQAVGADAVELHTGCYALAPNPRAAQAEIAKLTVAAEHAHEAGLDLHAGHGLTYRNVAAVAALPHVHELNIGHSIIARAILIGLQQAVRDMKQLIVQASAR